MEFVVHEEPAHPRRAVHGLTVEAQLDCALDAYARLIAPARLLPGEACRERAGLGMLPTGSVLVYLRDLDPSSAWDHLLMSELSERATLPTCDALVLAVTNEGWCATVPTSRQLLEPILNGASATMERERVAMRERQAKT